MTATDIKQLLKSFGDEFRGYPLFMQALHEDQVLIVLKATPSLKLRLSHESDLTRKLDQMGISDEAKTGDKEFDDDFLVTSEAPERLGEVVTAEFRAKIRQLAPFLEFEMTGREYRMLTSQTNKLPQLLEILADIADSTRSPESE